MDNSLSSLDRRKLIIEDLSDRDVPVTANILAHKYGVTRQIIVSDIAILRANGYDILSTQRGYCLSHEDTETNREFIIASYHETREKLEEEMLIIVDEGCSVKNVSIEHPIYGTLTSETAIRSRRYAKDFMTMLEINNVEPLSRLTNGAHSHVIMYDDERSKETVIKRLREAGVLVE